MCRGDGVRGGGGRSPPLNSGCKSFPKGLPFGIILQNPFSADQLQNFSKGASGANITNFENQIGRPKNKGPQTFQVFSKNRPPP